MLPGRKWSARGFLALPAPVAPARDYSLYVPAGYEDAAASPLLVWLHGCRQTPQEFAAGTGVLRLADEERLLVLLPGQSPAANAERCWNWFDPMTAAGAGEAAIVTAQIEQVAREYRVDRARIYAAGLSSGGALAATLALRAPHLIAAVAIHSGMPCGAARSAVGARRAMRAGPETDTDAVALAARARGHRPAVLPALILHGGADPAVAPVNAERLVRQFLLFNGMPAQELAAQSLPQPARRQLLPQPGSLGAELRDWHIAGRLAVRLIEIEGLGHAWSGGAAGMDYFDPRGPDATRLVWEFFGAVRAP
ncbi:MAG: PHB depolymerase family esterase [Pseudomonadota bacterium]